MSRPPRRFVASGLAGLVLAALCHAAPAGAADPALWLDAWLTAQTNVHTWSAEFLQTRSLPALAQPLTARGRVWFAAPNRFRWELGTPPQTIAVRQSDQMLVIYPRLRRVERYPLGGNTRAPWQEALALVEAGFPRSRDTLEGRFRVKDLAPTNDAMRLILEPKTAGARRFLSEIQIVVLTNQFALAANAVRFADGSVLRNDFTNAICNGLVDETLFTPPLDPGWTVVEPGGP